MAQSSHFPAQAGRPGLHSFRRAIRHASTGALAALATLVIGPLPAKASSAFLTARASTPAPAGFSPLCSRYGWLCSTSRHSGPLGADALAVAAQVNGHVNSTVPQIEDIAQYGVTDRWALPTARGGDCEDIAMLKKKLLVQAGLPAQDLLIATVLDRNRQNHAVLVMRTAEGDYILDNLTRQIKPWEATGYTFLTMQDPRAPARWDAVLEGGMLADRLAGN